MEQSPSSKSTSNFSPISKTLTKPVPTGRNLTGNARFVRDLAADAHASVQHWNAFYLEGMRLLQSITQVKQDASYSDELQELCDKLESVCNAMDKIVSNLEGIADSMKIVNQLEKNLSKLFGTWPLTKFGEVTEMIYEAYKNEARIKRMVLEDVAHFHTESWKMLCLSTWVYQPYISGDVEVALESLLIETGHR